MASEGTACSNAMRLQNWSYQFKVDYSKCKHLPIGGFISSPTFTAGGYDWDLQFYPQGNKPENQGSHVSLFLCLKSKAMNISAGYELKVISKHGRFPIYFIVLSHHTFLNTSTISHGASRCEKFIDIAKMEDLFLEDGSLIIYCNFVRVSPERTIAKNNSGGLSEHMEELWVKGETFDVTFEVEGESISAHKLILATRSPVFKAKLFGPMAEATMEHIKIEEMKAEVFKALLHFIYTDQLSVNGSIVDETSSFELLMGLLVAADRYAISKLIFLCEEQLANNLSVDNVITTLFLADRHSCPGLKRKCLNFASAPENYLQLAVSEEFLHIMSGALPLFAELSEQVKSSCFAKKQKTGG